MEWNCIFIQPICYFLLIGLNESKSGRMQKSVQILVKHLHCCEQAYWLQNWVYVITEPLLSLIVVRINFQPWVLFLVSLDTKVVGTNPINALSPN